MTNAPVSATMFAFNVGFGDCFLLRFQYDDNTRRHILIDFGSTRYPSNRPSNFLTRVAKQIKELCGGKLDIIVATHRHKDHIYGFRTNKSGTAPGNVIADCDPTLILQPWTEHPDAPVDATVSPDQLEESRAFAGALKNMSSFSAAIYKMAKADEKRGVFKPKTRAALSFLGENNIANKSAIKNLLAMGESRRYLAFGQDPGTEDILPGVKVEVLGPPTLEQGPQIARQRSRHEEEYWHLQAAASRGELAASQGRPAFPNHVAKDIPQWARWGRYRLRRMRENMLMPIVRRLDAQMNNTSLILLFTVGDKSLLFPGDAQWENWSYALSQPEVREKLKSVDVYKVGHHGSLNATPKSLWNLLENKGGAAMPDRLTSVMSTKHGVHGHSHDTAVPRETLVEALTENTHFHTTEDHEISSDSEIYYTEIELEFCEASAGR